MGENGGRGLGQAHRHRSNRRCPSRELVWSVGSVRQCVGECWTSVGPVSVDTSVGGVGSVGSSVGAVWGQCQAILTVEGRVYCVRPCQSARGVSGAYVDGNVDSPLCMQHMGYSGLGVCVADMP